MHGTRGERYHHLAMVVVENGDGADGWNRRAVGKEKEKKKGEEVVLFGRGGSGGVAESRERAC